MKVYIILCLCFVTRISIGQTPYKINYSKPTTLKINYEYEDRKEKFYDVEFLNGENQKVKSIRRAQEENHSSKTGYDINQSVHYYFYRDTLLIQEIGMNPDYRALFKTDYTYDENNRSLGWTSYSIKPKISRDSFEAIINKDILLNNPSLFPTKDLTLETKELKKYENNMLVYKCYYERYGKLKAAIPAREQFFKYNDKGQLVEHISNPKSDAGGTAFLQQIFEYNDNNQLIIKEWYENGKHQATDELVYSDSAIKVTTKYYDIYGNGDPKKYSVTKWGYGKRADGNFYSGSRKFSVCDDAKE